jgi:hypothetical protein
MSRTVFLLILFSLVSRVSEGQVSFNRKIKQKGDSVLNTYIGKGINRIILKFEEAYQDTNDYRAIYRVTFPENNYSDKLIIYFDSTFHLADSNFLRTFPDYILEDKSNDLISKDSALSIAKQSGLCTSDILDISFYKLYNSKTFAWVFRADNKKERSIAESKRLKRQTTLRCRTRIINAKTGEIIADD